MSFYEIKFDLVQHFLKKKYAENILKKIHLYNEVSNITDYKLLLINEDLTTVLKNKENQEYLTFDEICNFIKLLKKEKTDINKPVEHLKPYIKYPDNFFYQF